MESKKIVRAVAKSSSRKFNTRCTIWCLLCSNKDQNILARCWKRHCKAKHSQFVMYRMKTVCILSKLFQHFVLKLLNTLEPNCLQELHMSTNFLNNHWTSLAFNLKSTIHELKIIIMESILLLY